MDIYKRIYELENEIAALPQGSINMKKIYGKEQPYPVSYTHLKMSAEHPFIDLTSVIYGESVKRFIMLS